MPTTAEKIEDLLIKNNAVVNLSLTLYRILLRTLPEAANEVAAALEDCRESAKRPLQGDIPQQHHQLVRKSELLLATYYEQILRFYELDIASHLPKNKGEIQ